MNFADDAPEFGLLFPELDAQLPIGRPGRVEAMLLRAIQAAQKAGVLVVEDWGLVGGCLAAARALDIAERGGRGGGPYAVAALLSPYREALQALRLPATLAPAEAPRPPAGTASDAGDFLGDIFGTPGPPGA